MHFALPGLIMGYCNGFKQDCGICQGEKATSLQSLYIKLCKLETSLHVQVEYMGIDMLGSQWWCRWLMLELVFFQTTFYHCKMKNNISFDGMILFFIETWTRWSRSKQLKIYLQTKSFLKKIQFISVVRNCNEIYEIMRLWDYEITRLRN